MPARVSSKSIADLSMKSIINIQNELKKAQRQIDGKQYATFKEMPGNTWAFINYESKFEQSDFFAQENKKVMLKVRVYENKLHEITDIAAKFRTFLTSVTDSAYDLQQRADVQALSVLDQVQKALNYKFDNSYIFSGATTDVQPVTYDITSGIFNVNAPPPDFTYYQGDTALLTHKIDETREVTYGITANNPAFEKLLRGIGLIATTHDSPPNHERVVNALELVRGAIVDLSNISGEIGNCENTIDDATNSLENEKTYYTEVLSDIISPSPEEVVSRFLQLQQNLEAALMAEARFMSLSLLRYVGDL